MGLFDTITKYKSLEELNAAWADCEKCTLRVKRGVVCKSIATEQAQVLVVGRSPTVPECISGRGMMTDPGGVEIRRWFAKLARVWGLKDSDLAFANIVKCAATVKDPNKPDYRIDEQGNRIGDPIIPTAACSKYLEEEIALIQPKVIISIGQSALTYFAKRSKKIPGSLDKARKRVWRYRNANFLSSVMPIAASDDMKPFIAEDFQFLRKHAFDDLNAAPAAEAEILNLQALYSEVDVCQACELCEKSAVKVFGNGWSRSPLMIVGEAPGRKENETGAPFVGDAGRFLMNKILRKVSVPEGSQLTDTLGNFDIKRAYLTNAVKGWPGKGNPTPTSDQIVACNVHLRNQIKIVNPRVIICLGKVAAEAVTGIKKSLGSMRTQLWNSPYTDAKIVITWHPSYAMRMESEGGDGSDKAKNEIIADINKAIQIVETPTN